jgi:hypothetical protein
MKGLVWILVNINEANIMKHIFLFISLFSSYTLFASPFAKPSEASGILNLSIARPSANIFPVTIYAIDGDQTINRNKAIWLKPGVHTISVNSVIDLSNRSKSLLRKHRIKKEDKNELKITIEEGKTYYIGYDANANDPNEWRPVVWKVK